MQDKGIYVNGSGSSKKKTSTSTYAPSGMPSSVANIVLEDPVKGTGTSDYWASALASAKAKASGTSTTGTSGTSATTSYAEPTFSFSYDSKPTYTSKYQSTIDALLSKIANREAFSYDFNADPLYQQYKDQYTKLGNEASMNAVANAAAMTGGFGNSYGATAASQANQQYMTQLNEVIPELYSAALTKYNDELDGLRSDLSMYQAAEDADYAKYRDAVSDYYTDYENAYSQSRTAYEDALEAAARKASYYS